MSWQKYEVIFRLLSPLHVGFRKTGNLMQTREYVPGKVFWAALTARLTRDSGNGADGRQYVIIGNAVNESFRFGYLYPALPKSGSCGVKSADDLTVHYPWNANFDYLFLDSYASTALDYDSKTAAEALLHETEFMQPYTRPYGSQPSLPVYLYGDLYVHSETAEQDGVLKYWQDALSKLQFGGERGYGWGRVRLESLPKVGNCGEPTVEVKKGQRVLAHVLAEGLTLYGSVEPLVGWERNPKNGTTNWHLSSPNICYPPGATVKSDCSFTVNHYGIWKKAN